MSIQDGARPRSGQRRSRRAGGFTLIEIMVVIVILGVLAALVVPRVMSRPDEARVVAARQDVAAIMQALKLYRLDNQRYPSTEQGLQALVTRPAAGPAANNWKQYLDRLPVDPWGKPYQYLNPGLRGEIDVFSLGGDGGRVFINSPHSTAGTLMALSMFGMLITSAVMGVGATKRASAVRWGVVREILTAWVLTIPMAGLSAALFYAVAHLLLG